ncbi:hypothetical protein G6F24_016242 [Rhizopus arrhizus]|nr:hypothetical protein G6F24_016242 [Rhizopus arrhizus]
MLQPVLIHLHPTGPVQQHVGHALRVLLDQPVQKLCDLEATHFRQRADHAEIDHADAPVAQVDDVAGVRVGVEASVLQHHLQHDVGAAPCEFAAVQPRCIDAGEVAAGDAVNEVLHVQALAGPLPVHAGNQDVAAALEIARDALGVAAFGSEIELAAQ